MNEIRAEWHIEIQTLMQMERYILQISLKLMVHVYTAACAIQIRNELGINLS